MPAAYFRPSHLTVHPLLALLFATVAACGGSTATPPDAGAGHHDASVDAQGDDDAGCVADPDFSRPCVNGVMACVDPSSGCEQSDQLSCSNGKWVAVSVGNCCAGPDGRYWSPSGDCDETFPDASASDGGDGGEADAGEDAADGGEDSGDAGHGDDAGLDDGGDAGLPPDGGSADAKAGG